MDQLTYSEPIPDQIPQVLLVPRVPHIENVPQLMDANAADTFMSLIDDTFHVAITHSLTNFKALIDGLC